MDGKFSVLQLREEGKEGRREEGWMEGKKGGKDGKREGGTCHKSADEANTTRRQSGNSWV